MTSFFRKAAWMLLASPLVLASCQKEDDDNTLEGPVPVSDFTVSLNTSQFPIVATFTSTSKDAFLFQWNFGDTPVRGSGPVVTHTYKRPGPVTATLTTAGPGGTGNVASKEFDIPTACGNNGFAVLTACATSGATTWTISDQPRAIVKLAANGTEISASGVLPACQLDDQFSFTSVYTFSYDAGASTFANGACGDALSLNADFVYKVNGSLGQIILQNKRSFIGLPDSVVNKTYDIVEASATRLRLQGTNPDGTKTIVTYAPQLSALDRAKRLLTGGSSRTWVLDNTQEKTIVVGPSDADPTSYFGGGAAGSLPGCQADDEFTFSDAGVYTYNAKAETLVAGAGCGAPLSGTSAFTFGGATGAGIAQFELARPTSFIGVTDANNRIYRILAITEQTMLLRVGPPTGGVVHTMKLRVK
ncbi:PKD domain-containing protein [Hymenobacter aquaticus]|uniref:PKD domain-containing protein n=1 Tax=Hymenobacter aquaticus TaxID=1867101 RepID=A0A4Z0PUD4_9BACT|nr:PKD domain-containing protein [Hymenobacter aquaticus]TGE21327.1 PKD domain-containing protein [Hymenobacter aquaticus]